MRQVLSQWATAIQLWGEGSNDTTTTIALENERKSIDLRDIIKSVSS